MKNLLIFYVLLFTVSICAQTYQDDKKMINSTSLDTSNEQLNFLTNITNNKGFQINQGNSVFIDQVGQGNIAQVAIISNNSEVNLLQDGFANKSFINLRADFIRENVQQIGNNNLFFDYSGHGAQLHEVNLIQDGSYNAVISVGRNSISERLQLKQTGIGKRAFIIHN